MPANVTRRLTQLARRLSELDRVIVTAAGETIIDELDRQLAADTGDGALSGMAGGRYKLTVKLTPLANPEGVRIRPSPKQSGMWTILDSGRRGGYDVGAKPKRRRKAKGKAATRATSRRAAMNIAGVWRAGPFTVDRSWSGKRTWRKARDTGMERATVEARDLLRRAVNGA